MFVNSGMKVWKREEQFMNNVKVQTKLIIVMLANDSGTGVVCCYFIGKHETAAE